jgi:hypothetical protein
MDGTKTDTNDSLTANYLYNSDFISFLNENFMPYIGLVLYLRILISKVRMVKQSLI